MGNLNTNQFMVLPLCPVNESFASRARIALGLGLQPLEVSGAAEFQNLWQISRVLNLTQPCQLHLWQLYRHSRIVTDTFVPGLVAVHKLHGHAPADIWRGAQGAMHPIADLQHAHLQPDDSDEFLPLMDVQDHEREDGSQREDESDPGANDGWSAESSEGEEDDNRGLNRHRRRSSRPIMARLEELAAEGPVADPVPEPPLPDAVGEPPAALPGPPRSPEEEEAGEGMAAEPRPGRRFGPLDPERPTKPITWVLPDDMGTIVFEPGTQILSAHCPLGCKYGPHGPARCALNRKVSASKFAGRAWQGRPLGLLMAWLRAATSSNSKEEHFNLTKQDPQATELNFAARAEGRQWLETCGLGGLPGLLSFERPQHAGEDAEPATSR